MQVPNEGKNDVYELLKKKTEKNHCTNQYMPFWSPLNN